MDILRFFRRSTPSAERACLDAGVEKLKALLRSHGFRYKAGHTDVSSGGPFASGSFWRGSFEIGLIVRDRCKLGTPNYSQGDGYAGHEDLIAALNAQGAERLVPGPWPTYGDKDGGDPFEALRADLQDIILPALREGEATFRDALSRAMDAVRRERGF